MGKIDTIKSSIEQKKCPNCGSTNLKYDVATQKIRCEYCKNEIVTEKLDGFIENLEELQGILVGEGAKDIDDSNTNLVVGKCPSCGGEVILDAENNVITTCHWCQSTLSVTNQVPSGIVSDAILPFKVTKEEAFEDMKKIVDKKKFFIDKNFKENFKIENIRGVYMPYIVLDINGHANFIGIGGKIVNKKEKIYSSDYVYDMDIYEVNREFDVQIENLVETADSKQLKWKEAYFQDRSNQVLKSLLPFDIENAKKWDTNYVKGYTLEKRDINIETISDRMKLKAKDVIRHKINKDVDYDAGVCWKKEDFEIYGQQWKTIYLPVWIYSYNRKEIGKIYYNYMLAENGRTRELNYSIPINDIKTIILSILLIPFIPILFGFLFALRSYEKFDFKNRYDQDTKSKISNMNVNDTYKETIKNHEYSTIMKENVD